MSSDVQPQRRRYGGALMWDVLRWGCAVVIWDFGLFTLDHGSVLWATISLVLFGLPLALQATPWVMTRVYALWFGVFLVLQSMLSPFTKSEFITLEPNLHSTIDVRTSEAPGIRPGVRHITTDAKGFRVTPPIDYDQKRGTRIFAIGGSTTEDAMMDDSATWTHLVQKGLDSLQVPAEVINTGVAGLRARNHLATLKVVLRYQPDLVLILVGGNDWNKQIRDQFEPSSNFLRPPVLRNSPFGKLVNRYFVAPMTSRAAGKDGVGQHLVILQPEDLLASLNLASKRTVRHEFHPSEVSAGYRKDMEDIASTCRDAGVPCIFLTQPHAYSAEVPEDLRRWFWMTPPYTDYTLDVASMTEIANLYNEFLVAFAKRHGAPLCDVAAGVTPSLQVFYDDMHFTDAGAARVAELVLPCVVQALRK